MEIPKVKEIRWNSLRRELEFVTEEGRVEAHPVPDGTKVILGARVKRFALSGRLVDKEVSGDWRAELYQPSLCRLEEEEVVCE